MEVADEAAPGVEPSVPNRERQEPRHQASDLMTVPGVEFFAAAVGKNCDRVGRDELRPLDKRLGNPLSQILLQLAGTFVTERGIAATGRRVESDRDMFTEASRGRKANGSSVAR